MLVINFYATCHFHWHTLWRVVGLGVNYLINKNPNRKAMLLGALEGWKTAFQFNYIFHTTCQINLSEKIELAQHLSNSLPNLAMPIT